MVRFTFCIYYVSTKPTKGAGYDTSRMTSHWVCPGPGIPFLQHLHPWLANHRL